MSREYQPKRASGRWLEGAPSYVYDCFDHKKGLERYTILLGGPDFWQPAMGRTLQYLGTCSSGIAISLFGECSSAFRPSQHRVRWADLPEELRKHIIGRCGPDRRPETTAGRYTPNRLFDMVRQEFKLQSFVHVADFLGMDSALVSRLRHHKADVTSSTVLRVHEATGWSVAYIRDLLGDTSEEFFESSKKGKWPTWI